MSKKGGAPAAKAKKVEDKTFGMKNKKGKSAQKAQNQYQSAGKSKQDLQKEAEARARKEKKKLEEKEKAEREQLFKAVQTNKIQQKAPPGVDPKSIVCANLKAGKCVYGDKCRFSHDLAVERKSEKRDIYTDTREAEGDDMSLWDEKKLAEVVAKKAIGKPHNPTAGICKFFLTAVESRKYGWFWECPKGADCPYRHALPPGFVLKRDQKKEEKKTEIAIEDIVDDERRALKDGAPMTEENFLKWKAKAAEAREKAMKKEKVAQPTGRKTGRQLLEENADRYTEDEDGEGEFDVIQLLKQKKAEEDQLDLENAAMVEIMQKELSELDKEGEKRVEAEAAAMEAQRQAEKEAAAKAKAEEEAATSTTTTTATTTTTTTTTTTQDVPAPEASKQLQGVDTALFAEDLDNLPDFDDEEENGAQT